MHLNTLRVFVAVHDYGSFQKAADVRGVTQSAVTKTIRKLESHYGVLLIERGTKANLTPAGRALYDGAIELLNAAAAIEQNILAEKSAVTGTVRVGAASPLLHRILLPVVANIMRAHPAVRIKLRVKLSSELLSWVSDGRLDLAIAFDVESIPSDVVSTTLGTQRYHLVARKDGPFAGRHVSIDELSQAQWLLPFKDIELRRSLEHAFADAGYGPLDVRVESEIGTIQATQLLCDSNLIAIMAEQSYRALAETQLTAIETPLPMPISQVALYQRRRTPSTGLFAATRHALVTATADYFT